MAKFTGHTITSDSVTGSAEIERSLKFHDGDSAYLSRTPGSAGNRKTFTFSCWFKRSTPVSYTHLTLPTSDLV